MKHVLLGICTVLFLTGADDKKPDAKELKLLKGTWKVVSMVNNGKEDGDVEGRGITFDGEEVTIKEPNGESKGKCTLLDPTKNPKQIDLQRDENRKLHGIYELKGDELKICITRSDNDRPTAFESKEGSNCRLVVLKREK